MQLRQPTLQTTRTQLGQPGLAQPRHTRLQQLGGFHRAVVADEVIAPVIAPVHLRSALEQAGDLAGRQLQRQRLQPAQLDLGVLIHNLLQRQHEQSRRVATSKATPVGNLHVTNEGTERKHTVVFQVQATVRPRRTARPADHQPQHAVAPAAHRLRAAFGKQVVHRVDACRVEVQQRRRTLFRFGLEQGQRRSALRLWKRRRCSEVSLVPLRQRGAPAGELAIEHEMLGVHCQVLGRVLQLIGIRTAVMEVVVATAEMPGLALPSGQITPAHTARPVRRRTVGNMGQFVYQRAAACAPGAGHAVIQKIAAQRDAAGEGAAMHLGGKAITPAHLHLRRQGAQQAIWQQ